MPDGTLHRKLERAVNELIWSARIDLRVGKKWPTTATVPTKKITRLADIMNQLSREKR